MSTPPEPTPPPFPLQIPEPLKDPVAESLRRRKELVIACRLTASLGLDWGTAGHITVRDARHPDCFWVNAYGRAFGLMGLDDLLLVDATGRVLEGNGTLNPAAFAVHAAIHEARPEVLAAAHGHSTHGKAWATLGRRLDPITQDACAFYDDHDVLELFSGVVLSEEEGQLITRTLGRGKALVLQSHGLLTVGSTLEACIWWFVAMDNACRVQLMAEAVGRPRTLPHEVAARTAKAVGRDENAYFAYRNLRDAWLATQPALFGP